MIMGFYAYMDKVINNNLNLSEKYFKFLEKIVPFLFFLFGFSIIISISLMEISKVIIFVIYLPSFIIKFKVFKKNIIAYLLLTLFIMSFISILVRPPEDYSFYIKYLNILLFPVGVMAVHLHKYKLKWLIWGLFAGATIQTIIIIIEFVNNIDIRFSNKITIHKNPERYHGTQATPLLYSSVVLITSFLVIIIPFFFKKLAEKKYLAYIIGLIFSLFFFTGILLSETRGAIVGYITSIIVFQLLFFIFVKHNKKKSLLMLIGILGFATIFFSVLFNIFPSLLNRVLTIRNFFESYGGRLRLGIYSTAMEEILENPLFGRGFIRFQAPDGNRVAWHSHNNYFQIGVNNGIIGIAILIITDIIVGIKLLIGLIKNRFCFYKSLIYISLICAYISNIIYGLSDCTLFGASSSPLIFFGIGVISELNFKCNKK